MSLGFGGERVASNCAGVLTSASSDVAVSGDEFGESSRFASDVLIFLVGGAVEEATGWAFRSLSLSFERFAALRVSERVETMEEDDRLLLVELRCVGGVKMAEAAEDDETVEVDG